MLRVSFVVASMGTVVAIASCTGGSLVSTAPDASTDACGGLLVPARCIRRCDGSQTQPSGQSCPTGYTYVASYCTYGSVGFPVINTCGDDGGTSDAGPTPYDAGPTTGVDGTGAGQACTDLVNDAPPAPVRFHSGDRTADTLGAGGTIVDGIYDLNAVDIYRSSDLDANSTSVTTIRISNGGTRIEYVAGQPGDGGIGSVEATLVGTLAASGTQVTETWICPAPSTVTEDYTATATRLMLSNPLYVKRYVRR